MKLRLETAGFINLKPKSGGSLWVYKIILFSQHDKTLWSEV